MFISSTFQFSSMSCTHSSSTNTPQCPSCSWPLWRGYYPYSCVTYGKRTVKHTLTVTASDFNEMITAPCSPALPSIRYSPSVFITLAASTMRAVASASSLAAASSFFCCSESDCDSASDFNAFTSCDVACSAHTIITTPILNDIWIVSALARVFVQQIYTAGPGLLWQVRMRDGSDNVTYSKWVTRKPASWWWSAKIALCWWRYSQLAERNSNERTHGIEQIKQFSHKHLAYY